MAKVKFTAARIEKFHCPKDKEQAFLWCDEVAGLGIRATAASDRKKYIFQSKVNGKTMRVTIGDISAWSIAAAQKEARSLQVTLDQGNDPRQVKTDKEAEQAAKQAHALAMEAQEAREALTLGDRMGRIFECS